MDRTTLSRIHRLEMMFSELGNTLFPIVVSSSAPNFPTEKAVWIDADDMTISFQYKVGNTSIWVAFGDITIHKLIDLYDVDVTDISNDKLLVYDSISELHKYKDYLTALADLLDVDNSNKGDGKVPVYRTATSKHEYESIDDKANSGDLATIATTGSYNDLDNLPSIPSQYTDEMAQDAVGGILTDSDEIDFEYDDYTPEISATIKPGSIDESKLNVSVNASLDKADGSLQIDQTTPQTITNGIPLLESTRVIDEEHEIIDKQFISEIFINTGIRYYLTNTNSDVTGFLITSTVKPVLATENKLITFSGVISDVLIGQWVLNNNTSEKTFNKGIYSFSIYSQILGVPDPDHKVKIFFEIWEIDSDGNDVEKILESSKSDFIPYSKSEIIISGILDSEYKTTVGNYVCIKIYGDSSGDNCKIYFYYLGTTNTGLTTPINKDILDTLYNPLLGYTPTQKLTATITIAVADWEGGLTCTKAVAGLLVTDTVMPVIDDTNRQLIADFGIKKVEIAAGNLTFTAETTPDEEITFTIDYIRGDAIGGGVVWFGGVSGGGGGALDKTFQTLTEEATITFNAATSINGSVTLTASRILGNISNAVKGEVHCVKVIQGDSGGYTLTFGNQYKFSGGVVPILSATVGAVDLLYFMAVSTSEFHFVNAIFDLQTP